MNQFELVKGIRIAKKHINSLTLLGVYPYLETDIFRENKIPYKVGSYIVRFLANYASCLNPDVFYAIVDALGRERKGIYLKSDLLRVALFKLRKNV